MCWPLGVSSRSFAFAAFVRLSLLSFHQHQAHPYRFSGSPKSSRLAPFDWQLEPSFSLSTEPSPKKVNSFQLELISCEGNRGKCIFCCVAAINADGVDHLSYCRRVHRFIQLCMTLSGRRIGLSRSYYAHQHCISPVDTLTLQPALEIGVFR